MKQGEPVKIFFAVAIYFTLCLAISALTIAQTSSLEQSGVKRITIRSEIRRGCLEMAAVADSSAALDFDDYASQLRAVIQKNREANTDSDGFLLGARLVELTRLHIRINAAGIDKFNEPSKYDRARDRIKLFRREITRIETKLGIDDVAFLDAAPFENKPDSKKNVLDILALYR